MLSVHVPLRKETEGLVGEEMIRKLKKGAVIVNTARGKVIDEEALIRALEDGHVRLFLPLSSRPLPRWLLISVCCCNSSAP